MPTSFDAMHDETRPLRLLEPAARPRPNRVGAALAAALLIAFPMLVVALL